MLRSDLFDVAALPPRSDGPARLPRYVSPADGEALASWVVQLSAELGFSPLAFGRGALGVDGASRPEWWRCPEPHVLMWIAQRTGLAPDRIRAMTFLDWEDASAHDEPDRFGAHRWRMPTPNHARGRRIDICPQCVAEDERPYLRLIWMLGWVGVCPRHRAALTGECPSCGGVLRVASLKTSQPLDLLACRRCGVRLAGGPGPTAHEAAIALQEALIEGRQSGTTTLPGVGPLDWATATALADVLLATVWVGGANARRERLFARIGADLGMTADAWVTSPWTTNYGGLLILAWFLTDLPVRLPRGIGILCSPKLDGLLKRVPGLDGELEERLRVILAPAVAKRPQGRRAWRPWLDDLPTGGDLRIRAAQERYKHRRQRLTALAALRDCAAVEEAAALVGANPTSLYRWLRRGAAGGLDAALERPTGKPALTAAQAETLGQWIAADRHHQHRQAIVARAAELFGVELNPDAASKLRAKHGRAKPGCRRRLWGPKHGPRQRAGSTHDPAPGR